jgi:hypothetical protein
VKVALFSCSVFGELKSVRMPKKVSGTGKHRGFAFIDFLTKEDAKVCCTSLCFFINEPKSIKVIKFENFFSVAASFVVCLPHFQDLFLF